MKMFMIFILMTGSCFAAEPSKGNQLEFDESVVEGLGGSFSGVTAVKSKHEGKNLYSKQVDFAEKVKESIAELPFKPMSVEAGDKK